MNIAIQIPIKNRSSKRIPGKNFKQLAGKPLAFWLLDELSSKCPAAWDLYVDSEGHDVMRRVEERYGERYKFHLRNEWFAEDHANGNHLISQFAIAHPEYDIYIQAFVTAVTLPGKVIMQAVREFVGALDTYDSMLLVTEETGWFWFKGRALNYDQSRANGLPRSQDAVVLQETTGLYAITRDAVFSTGCRIGNRPMFYCIEREFARDVDTMDDFCEVERVLLSFPSGEESDQNNQVT